MKQRTGMYLLCAAALMLLLPCTNLSPSQALAADPGVRVIAPCEVLTQADAEAIMGEAMKEGESRDNKVVGQKLCLYNAAEESSFAFLQISLTQNAFMPEDTLTSGQNARRIYETTKSAFPDRETVNGMGDEAFIATPGIHILSGDYYIVIGAGNLQRNKDKVMAAGKKAVENLGGMH